ncbi:Vacuolar protein sorting-associated protein 53 [Intoshia linei]|uniref:Vacuolar protein sorting-associated protein 53 homolog n=1 Tax=Intoshia linei TaxID=1819745 RepID=A0A177B1X6_9BILA|nr:Vacuolar protein sorting-associated protein 53 [Intoshia linei]
MLINLMDVNEKDYECIQEIRKKIIDIPGGIVFIRKRFESQFYRNEDCQVSKQNFCTFLQENGIYLQNHIIIPILDLISKDEGNVDFERFLVFLRGPLSKSTRRTIEKAFNKADVTCKSFLDYHDVISAYDVENVSEYKSGQMTRLQLQHQFINNFLPKDRHNCIKKFGMDTEDKGLYYLNFPEEINELFLNILPDDQVNELKNFDEVEVINKLFSDQNSLGKLDETIEKVQYRINEINVEIKSVIRQQDSVSKVGQTALNNSSVAISELVNKISEICDKASESEKAISLITKDVRHLDNCKKNIIETIKMLNQVQLVISGLDSLGKLSLTKNYNEVAKNLDGVIHVVQNFKQYRHIERVENIFDRLYQVTEQLQTDIKNDFRDDFLSKSLILEPLPSEIHQRLFDQCSVINILGDVPREKFLTWLINEQLNNYRNIFACNLKESSLDCINNRYRWIKKFLIFYGKHYTPVFPPSWEICERVCKKMCEITFHDIKRMLKENESTIEIGTFIHCIKKTLEFENICNQRFSGSTFDEPMSEHFNGFSRLISSSFSDCLGIYLNSQQKALSELMLGFEKSLDKIATNPFTKEDENEKSDALTPVNIYPSVSELFIFFKNTLQLVGSLMTHEYIHYFADMFKQFLIEYSKRVLVNRIPKSSSFSIASVGFTSTSILQSIVNSTSNKNERDDITIALENAKVDTLENDASFVDILNLNNMSNSNEMQRLNIPVNDQHVISRILCSSEYCFETIKKLEEKFNQLIYGVSGSIKSTEPKNMRSVSFIKISHVFSCIIVKCVSMLVGHLEYHVDSHLVSMSKLNWQNVTTVSETSNYVICIQRLVKENIPRTRFLLANSRKYFMDYCIKFAKYFVSRYHVCLYKCKNISLMGAEQLMNDTLYLKYIFEKLPSIEAEIVRNPPNSYLSVVVTGFERSESILKIILSTSDDIPVFVQTCMENLPDISLNEFQKILTMKGLKRSDINICIQIFKNTYQASITYTKPVKTEEPIKENQTEKTTPKIVINEKNSTRQFFNTQKQISIENNIQRLDQIIEES